MDQLKVFLRQCVKYRFWIAFGVALLLPTIGYLVGSGTINEETGKQEKAITGAKAEVGKYTTPGIVNGQYQPLAASKKEVLSQDVDATWRKLFATQESLLTWPPEVQERFRKWGRKYPADVDKAQVQSTIFDYTEAYLPFVEKIYGVFKPFNFDDGSGIVVAPDWSVLLAPDKGIKPDSPPDLTKIWAEQERLWVVTALLDAIAKINDGVGAKSWEDAVVKQINLLEVGASTDQDQKSIAKGDTLVPADVLASPDAGSAPAPPPTPTPGGGGEAGGMMGMGGLGGAKSNEVLYLKTDSQQFKVLPIKMTVLVDQALLPNYLVGLENSPMAIQVNEIEVNKPKTPVAKPAYGEKSSFTFGGGMGGGMGNRDEMVMGGGGTASAMGRAMGGNPYAGGGRNSGSSSSEMMMRNSGGGPGAGASKTKGGIDNRNSKAAEERKKSKLKENEAAKAKTDTSKIDQYYNVVEVTIYGQARFYLAPPAAPAPQPSTAPTPEPAPAPASETPKAEAPKAEAPKAEAPKVEAPKVEAPKAEAPKVETPAPSPTPKPDEAPKPEAAAPKAEDAKPDAPAPKAEEAKPDASAPKP